MSSVNRFDLLATCLRIAEVEDYIEVFEKNGIDSFNLKLLNRDDLVALGITDESMQEIFLDKISTLQIPSEEIKGKLIDQEYVQLVVYSISSQLQRHLASLSCAVLRKDIVINDVSLIPSLTCLEKSLMSLQKECERFRSLLIKPKKKIKKILFQWSCSWGSCDWFFCSLQVCLY